MNYKIEFSERALKEIAFFEKTGQSILVNKINTLLREIEIDPRTGTGHPEPLKYRPKC